jgi:hypothetical protein
MEGNPPQSKQGCAVLVPTGEVGIFWFITPTEILQDSVPLSKGQDDGEFINGPSGHYEFWERLKEQIPSLRGIEYDRVPRGRVIYSKKEQLFLVYGSKAMVSNKNMRMLILRDFNLVGCEVRFLDDSHYEIDRLVSLMSGDFNR